MDYGSSFFIPSTDKCPLWQIDPDACPEPFPEYVEQWTTKKGQRCFKCKLCKETYDGADNCGKFLHFTYRQILADLRSIRHKRAMEEYKRIYCDCCKVQFENKSLYERHSKSQRHKDKEAGIIPKVDCEVCNITFLCHAEYKRHIATKGHARKLLPPPQRDCSVCGIHVLSDKQMVAHLATRKHQRNSHNDEKNSIPPMKNAVSITTSSLPLHVE